MCCALLNYVGSLNAMNQNPATVSNEFMAFVAIISLSIAMMQNYFGNGMLKSALETEANWFKRGYNLKDLTDEQRTKYHDLMVRTLGKLCGLFQFLLSLSIGAALIGAAFLLLNKIQWEVLARYSAYGLISFTVARLLIVYLPASWWCMFIVKKYVGKFCNLIKRLVIAWINW